MAGTVEDNATAVDWRLASGSAHTIDDLFQILVCARDIPAPIAKKQITKFLQLNKLQIDFHVRGGARKTVPTRPATEEELKAWRAKRATLDHLYEVAPPEGVTGRFNFQSWELVVNQRAMAAAGDDLCAPGVWCGRTTDTASINPTARVHAARNAIAGARVASHPGHAGGRTSGRGAGRDCRGRACGADSFAGRSRGDLVAAWIKGSQTASDCGSGAETLSGKSARKSHTDTAVQGR